MNELPSTPLPPSDAVGPLHGVRVLELASEWTAWAGKLLGDLGADVVLVEPIRGAPMRRFGPLAAGRSDSDASLWWRHYQTSKRGTALDLDASEDVDAFRELAACADIVLEGEPAGRLAAVAADHDTVLAECPSLIWVSITPFGRRSSRSDDIATDLTLLADGGFVWSCGYDDRTIAPVRPAGEQSLHVAGIYAVVATLAALQHREATGRGQVIDVSALAAVNVTTEEATFRWLVAGQTVQRQTGRHHAVQPTMATMTQGIDGQPVSTGAPPRLRAEFVALLGWLDDLGLRGEFAETVFLEMAIERGGVEVADLPTDVEALAMYGAGRSALMLIASKIPGYDFFIEGQRRGLATSVTLAPDQVATDPHFVARGFPTVVVDEADAQGFVHPGAPFQMSRSPWRIQRRAPRLGEHGQLALRGETDTGEGR